MDKIILVGGGGHCRSCIDVIEQSQQFEIAGIIDMPNKLGASLFGYPVIGNDEDLPELTKEYQYFLVTLGQIETPERRAALYSSISTFGGKLATVISPRAYVSQHAHIGSGTIIMHSALINAGAYIGNNCIINSCALIEHDATVGDHCHISTGAIINGGTQIAENTFIGSNSVIRDNIRVGRNSLVSGGIGVMKEIPDNSFYAGKEIKPRRRT